MRLGEAFEAYKGWVRRSKSPLTAQAYTCDIRKFVEFVGANRDVKDLTVLDVSRFQDMLEKKGYSARSIYRVGYAIISFLEVCGRTDIARLVPTPVYSSKMPDWLPEEKVKEVIYAAGRPLDRAVLSVAYDLALRRGEVPLLNWEWYDMKNGTMKVHRLKRGKSGPSEHVLPLRDWARKELDEYLSWRMDFITERPHEALFVTRYGGKLNRMTRQTVLNIYRRAACKVGVNVSFHSFSRHSRLTNMAIDMIREKGVADLVVLAKFAGHRNPANTLLYVHLASSYLLQKREATAKHETRGEVWTMEKLEREAAKYYLGLK